MTIRHFVNRKIGLVTDPKPSISHTSIFHEQDTGSSFVSDNSTLNIHQGKDKIEILQNKTIDTENNKISNLIVDYPFTYLGGQVKGGLIPATTVQDSFYGVLEGITLLNPFRITQDQTNDVMIEFKAEASNKVGFSSQFPMARRDNGYQIKGEFKTTNKSMLIGFSNTQYFSTFSTIFNNNDIGVCIGFTISTANYSVFTNDGSGTPAVADPFTIPKDQALHTIEIILNPTNIICKLDTETKTITTKIPPLTTNLYLNVYGIL